MITLEIIYRVFEEGMIVEEIDEGDENEILDQMLPAYPLGNQPMQGPLPAHS